MIVSLEEIKEYLRLEADYNEDNNLLLFFLKVAEESLENQTGKVFNENNKSELASLYIKMYVAEQYEKRGATESNSEKVRFVLESVISQLSICGRYK
ncbi:TPA: phage gp6-like head-tail connector protein [Clostridioides difficile]|uniref:head-tail connector protein n=1 Tax=Clostridioides difficile TaxID=1496 RepID=UPI00038CA7F3|nr:head-tail connector protein [Clostridioides difficile]EQJ93981.1 phage gp6-like head-tail connector family protein [Clostridioides difficile P51]MDO0459751.1 head-tail connector protein [Clostridioides difficile]HBF1697476.1 phage gp6-like head-tail connector protein [Clostridioides difficile]HBF3265496.1 phage gp6-like head-tail connector protein [Clostridioides difficile]HBH0409664.1 phage gp6-like head-tail connector protein [Clostridioides difficile]